MTKEAGGAWRMIPRLASPSLPAGQPDGFYFTAGPPSGSTS